MLNLLRSLRPKQWTKNVVVLAPFIFALGDKQQNISLNLGLLAIAGAFLFCLISSSVYVLNDILDIEKDRAHPVKCKRPIASGALSISKAKTLLFLLSGTTLIGSYILSPYFAYILGGYFVMQIGYCAGLKKIPVVDVLIIALGFVLRALSGAVLIEVIISPWLLICTLFLALFLGFSKRRHEKIELAEVNIHTRPSLKAYNESFLDLLIGASAMGSVLSYASYTVSAETVNKFGSTHLIWTLPFAVLGLGRYLQLVYTQQGGDRPEKVLLTDIPVLLILAGYGATLSYLFFF